MLPPAPELKVEVHKLGNRYVAVTKDGAGHEILRNEFHYESTYLTYLGPPWLLDHDRLMPDEQGRLGQVLKGNPAQAQVSLQGWHLFQYLFGDGRALRRHLASVQREQSPKGKATGPSTRKTAAAEAATGAEGVSQLTLLFSPDAASLARLPWEYLFDGKQFPCLEGQLMISRRPLDVEPIAVKPTKGTLRLLLIIPSPTDQVPFDAELELGIVQDALAPLIRQGALTMVLLPEPTPSALLETLREEQYDVVLYVGHGAYHLPQHQGYLSFEDELGRNAMVSGVQLPHFVGTGRQPNLFIIAACQNAQVGIFDAVLSVANDVLHRGFPGVLGIPAPLRPDSARAFYRALFGGLTDGESVPFALRAGRWALRDADARSRQEMDQETPESQVQRLDWGLPSLLQRSPALVLRDAKDPTGSPATAAETVGGKGSDLNKILLSARYRELQAVRKALATGARVFYVLGSDGIGKRAFVAYLLDHLGKKPSACLHVDCEKILEPLSALALIADFWRREAAKVDLPAEVAAGTAASSRMDGLQAAEQLLDSQQSPRERARQAQALLSRKRVLFVFENLDTWFTSEEIRSASPDNAVLRDILVGLMSEPGHALFVLSGSRRWEAMSEIPATDQREIRLPLLSKRYAIQLFHQLPALREAVNTPELRQEIYRLVGGHPLVLQYLDRWLSFDNTLAPLSDIAPQARGRTDDWLKALTRRLLAELDPGAHQALRSLAILKLPFDARMVADLTRVAEEHARPLIVRWLALGLVELTADHGDGTAHYSLVSPVRRCLQEELGSSEITALHGRAAEAYGASYVNAARQQVLARTITTWSEERIGWLARDANGILGLRLRQATDPTAKRAIIDEALAWQYHLLQAGERQAATQIAQALAPELNRQGQQDLSRKLLQQSLPAHRGSDAAQRLDMLTNLRIDEGPLTEALHTYRALYRSLDPGTDVVQRTYVMLRMGHVHQRLGNLKAAIAHYQTALQIIRRREAQEEIPELTSEDAMTTIPSPSAQEEPDTQNEEAATATSAGEAVAAEAEVPRETSLRAEAECLARLAAAYRETGALREALVHSQAAKEHYQSLGEARGEAALEHEQGRILKLMDQTDRALERFVASLRICRQIGDQQCMADNLTEIGQLFDLLGKTDMAIQVIEEAIEHYEYLRSPEHGKVLSLLETLYAKQKRLSEAITRFQTTKRTLK